MRWFILSLAASLLATAPSAAQEATDSARHAEVRAVVHGFHAALAAGDSSAALERLHPAVVVYESGHAESLTQYRSGHLRSDIAFASAVRREVTGESISLWGDTALYTSEAHTTGEWRGRAIDAQGAETMVVVRTPEGWRIRHIHWSSR
ncbi:MAG: nuclear transport factor 2 family protein [Gemmatimonadetes bacterium]|nr:nuclear transport factor 2 family protein [Gemmatimonadota bacterium]